MNGDKAVQGVYQNRFHNVAAAHGVADGSKLVDVPDIPLEQTAGAHGEVLVQHLTAGEEATLHMVHNLMFVDGRKSHTLHHPGKQATAIEEGLHGIHRGAAKNKAEEPPYLLLP